MNHHTTSSLIGRLVRRFFPRLGELADYLRLSPAAKAERRRDSSGIDTEDPGVERVVREAVAWLCRAQDGSRSHDGGVARDYSLRRGWNVSYPETTGYIIPTMFDCADRLGSPELRERAFRMLDWLVSIQFSEGGFQGGKIDSRPVVPVTFNTGQILLGLARGARVRDRYGEPMRRAAGWLVKSQDPDGCWRRHPTPFAAPGEKSYETHVSWGLFEAARVEPGSGFGEAGLRQIQWALGNQRENGWFADCCLTYPARPLTHTLGYVLRGIIEAYRFQEDGELLASARRTADGLLPAIREDGYLPGRLDEGWGAAANYACLTGSAQIAHCLLMLYQYCGEQKYLDCAYRLNRFVRRTVRVAGPDQIRGGVKGSFPVQGDYGQYEFLNWAAKFMIDANLLEEQVRKHDAPGQAPGTNLGA